MLRWEALTPHFLQWFFPILEMKYVHLIPGGTGLSAGGVCRLMTARKGRRPESRWGGCGLGFCRLCDLEQVSNFSDV